MKQFVVRVCIVIIKFFLNIIYFFMRKRKLKKKVILISRQSNNPSIDFQMIADKIMLIDKSIQVRMFCRKIDRGIINKIKYCFYMLKVMWNLADSKVCIVDGYEIPVSMLKQRKELVVIQIWHALGAIKKFGYQSLGKKEGRDEILSKIMNMHKNYTYVIAPSNATKNFYQQAFNVEKEKILIIGMPRIDYLLMKEKSIATEIINNYPELKNKKNILYVPTFRKNEKIKLAELVKYVKKDKYNLIIKKHPSEELEEENGYIVDKNFKSIDWLNVADYIITDYSAIAFEAMLKNKPTYFYLYDIDKYKENRGLNINLFEEMPTATCKQAKELFEKIDNNIYSFEELNKFLHKYIETNNADNTSKIAELILKNIKGDKNG